MKIFLLILFSFIPFFSYGNNGNIVNYLYSKYNPLIINGKKLNKTDIQSIVNIVENQTIDPHPFYVLDKNIRNNKINVNDLKKSRCKFEKTDFMTCNLKGAFAEVYLNNSQIVKLVIKYNPKPFFKSLLKDIKNKTKIENFSRDLVVEIFNRKNFSNVKYYNVGNYVKVEMNY